MKNIGIILVQPAARPYAVACEEHLQHAVIALFANNVEPSGEVIEVDEPCPVCIYAQTRQGDVPGTPIKVRRRSPLLPNIRTDR